MQRTSAKWLHVRRSIERCVLWVALLGVAAPALGAQQEYRIGPVPEWVERIAPDETAAVPAGQVSNGVHYLLADVQTRAEARDQVQYRHYAKKALSQSGVEEVAHVEINFDPAYQTLTLHSVQVRRGGKAIQKLGRATIRVLQREKDLEYRIYDGRKSANVFLDDVRVGDVVEYAFSLRGANPVFRNRLSGVLDLQWAVPVYRLHGRLIWPAGRELYLTHHGTDLRPQVRERGRYREYRWEARDLPALVVDDGAPAWYDPYPWVQWSEFKDWEAVARWALPLYDVPERLGPALKPEVERIARESADPEQRLLSVLRFVQGEIRYLGVEIGAGSHAPSPPQLVMQRRFGDCKDKSLLTVTMLRALGIGARPVLVNTRMQRGVRQWHATPAAFDHVLVRASVNGGDYWIDPTRRPQTGALATLYQPDYGYALVVDASTRDLAPMTRSPASMSRRTVHAVFDARAGLEEPVRYTITTEHEGGSAETQRGTLAGENREELQKRYLNYYARYYPTITAGAPIAVREDERANRVTVTEQYLIADFWKRAEERKRREASIHVPDMAEYARQPRQPVRRAPLGLAHPIEAVHTTEVLLPSEWEIKPGRVTVEDPAFEFERQIAYAKEDRRLILTDRFRSRVDHIAPDEVPRYVANLDRVDNELGYSLHQYDSVPAAETGWLEKLNWPVAMLGAFILSLWVWLALRLYRYDPPPRNAPIDAKLQGVRGWLIVPAIAVVTQPLRILVDSITLLPSYATDTWANLTTAGSDGYHALWAPLLLYELGANLALLVFALLLAVLFFQKRRSAPLVFVGFVTGSAAVHALDLGLANAVPNAASEVTAKDWADFARGVLQAVVWGTYFLVSRRVKATFVNARPARRPRAAAQQAVG